MRSKKPLLTLNKLGITVGENELLKDISFEVFPNEIVAIVGESGSGKSLTALSIAGLLPETKLNVTSKQLLFNNESLEGLSESEWQKIRGNKIGMIFQEPQSSLNPSMKCGIQVMEMLNQHTQDNAENKKNKVLASFEQVYLDNPERIFNAYPHELSGGQKQRVMIAMALICNPQLLIADEPTTALDVTVQKEIISLIIERQKANKMSVLFISHDLTLVSQLADRVLVMYQGEIVESGTVTEIFNAPKEAYTRGLLYARPDAKIRLKRLPTIADFINEAKRTDEVGENVRKKRHEEIYSAPPLLQVKDLIKEHVLSVGLFKKNKYLKAVQGVSFDLFKGETLGLVGESGCGKSTLSRALIYLDPPTEGSILFQGKELSSMTSEQIRSIRKDIQFVFQDPYSALHPLKKIGQAIAEPLQAHQITLGSKETKIRVLELLEAVGLEASFYERHPHELSGGQRQRIVIARALATEPKLIICDEAVAALDISVQAQVLNLLNDLKEQFDLSYLFISHDLNVVKYMSDKIMVMQNGLLVEYGEADDLYINPKKTYTKKLIASIPKAAGV
jgi:peptide/nickel transport system ATP-binding protein